MHKILTLRIGNRFRSKLTRNPFLFGHAPVKTGGILPPQKNKSHPSGGGKKNKIKKGEENPRVVFSFMRDLASGGYGNLTTEVRIISYDSFINSTSVSG